jgi:hypothetical protein
MEVFIIVLEKGLLIETGWIMKKKKATRENIFGRKANGVQEV